MHLTAPRHAELIGRLAVRDTQGHVLEQFAVQSVAQLAGRDKLAFLARQRAVIDREGHLQRRLADLDELQRLRAVHRRHGVADGNIARTGEAHDIAHHGAVHRATGKSVNLHDRHNFGALGRHIRRVVVADHGILIDLDASALNASDADTPYVIVIVNGGHQQLERCRLIALRSRNVIQDRVEQRRQILARLIRRQGCRAIATGAVQHGGIQLIVVRAEINQQLQDLVLHFAEARVRLIYLVDADDDAMVELQRFLQNKAGLRHGSLGGIHQQDNTVDHLQHALHLAAEVGVPGGIDDVDFDTLVMNSGILGKNGDAPLPFQRAGIHDARHGFLVVPVDTSLLEQSVHQRGFAVVNVGDNGYISQIVSDHCFLHSHLLKNAALSVAFSLAFRAYTSRSIHN